LRGRPIIIVRRYNYRLGQEISDDQFAQFADEVRLGADRAAVIARMGLFEPALTYKERRTAAEAA
jgi:hypothetical protein